MLTTHVPSVPTVTPEGLTPPVEGPTAQVTARAGVREPTAAEAPAVASEKVVGCPDWK